jgi:hypothetical protein
LQFSFLIATELVHSFHSRQATTAKNGFQASYLTFYCLIDAETSRI